ncbi:hypothetical protein NDU88_009999 [Pleurodeles waltl]|uniref:Uncharacterized protein n=1 Tax=Pleurodeles waltl TaxID=8319 RepID=A0AAV7QV42_PLEWA|nr:hypothetical protein NDU88_009999 [Pleurodeles waltl]
MTTAGPPLVLFCGRCGGDPHCGRGSGNGWAPGSWRGAILVAVVAATKVAAAAVCLVPVGGAYEPLCYADTMLLGLRTLTFRST